MKPAHIQIDDANVIQNLPNLNLPCKDQTVALGKLLKALKYSFTTITPESHRLVLGRETKGNPEQQISGQKSKADDVPARSHDLQTLRDFFGWNRSIPRNLILPEVLQLAESAGLVSADGELVKSRVRFATLGDLLFMHSGFPTDDENSVFFGPDTYRFVRFLQKEITRANKIIDIGCGSGAGGVSLARFLEEKRKVSATQIYLADISDQALEYAAVNVAINDLDYAEIIKSDLFKSIPLGADTIVANPPFMMDERVRLYRNSDGAYGTGISKRIFESSLNYLQPGGTLALYTGACVVNGVDKFFEMIQGTLSAMEQESRIEYSYEELDPDIFGEELSTSPYADVDRIAAVGLILKML